MANATIWVIVPVSGQPPPVFGQQCFLDTVGCGKNHLSEIITSLLNYFPFNYHVRKLTSCPETGILPLFSIFDFLKKFTLTYFNLISFISKIIDCRMFQNFYCASKPTRRDIHLVSPFKVEIFLNCPETGTFTYISNYNCNQIKTTTLKKKKDIIISHKFIFNITMDPYITRCLSIVGSLYHLELIKMWPLYPSE